MELNRPSTHRSQMWNAKLNLWGSKLHVKEYDKPKMVARAQTFNPMNVGMKLYAHADILT